MDDELAKREPEDAQEVELMQVHNSVSIDKYLDLLKETLEKDFEHKLDKIKRELQDVLAAAGFICNRFGLRVRGKEVSIDQTVFDSISRSIDPAFEDMETLNAIRVLQQASQKYGVSWNGGVQVRPARPSRWEQMGTEDDSRDNGDEGIFK